MKIIGCHAHAGRGHVENVLAIAWPRKRGHGTQRLTY